MGNEIQYRILNKSYRQRRTLLEKSINVNKKLAEKDIGRRTTKM